MRLAVYKATFKSRSEVKRCINMAFFLYFKCEYLRFSKVRNDSKILLLIRNTHPTERGADADCFASESITAIYGLGKSWPQMNLDPLSPPHTFVPNCSFSSLSSLQRLLGRAGLQTGQQYCPQPLAVAPISMNRVR